LFGIEKSPTIFYDPVFLLSYPLGLGEKRDSPSYAREPFFSLYRTELTSKPIFLATPRALWGGGRFFRPGGLLGGGLLVFLFFFGTPVWNLFFWYIVFPPTSRLESALHLRHTRILFPLRGDSRFLGPKLHSFVLRDFLDKMLNSPVPRAFVKAFPF